MGITFDTSLEDKIGAGKIPGITPITIQGYVAGTASLTTIWPEANSYFGITTGAAQTISSANANDTSAGTGARTVKVTGLNASYAIVNETATMNGQTGVSLTNQYLVVNSIEVMTTGSTAYNEGIIYVGRGTVTTGKPANVDGILSSAHTISRSALYGMPANCRLYIKSVYAQSNYTTATAYELRVYTFHTDVARYKILYNGYFSNAVPLSVYFKNPLVVDPNSRVVVTHTAGGAGGIVACVVQGYQVDYTLADLP